MSITDFFKRLFKIEDQDYLDLLDEIRAGLADHSLDYSMIHFICNAPKLPHWKNLLKTGSFPLDKATLPGRLGRYVKAGYSPYEKLADAIKEAQEWAKTPEGKTFYEEQERKRLEALDAKNPPRNAIRLIKTPERHVSKFGGRPNLPDGIPWPKNPEGDELDFLAQIHFPEVPAGFGLPETGTLFVFYDNELMPWGNEKNDVNYWKIIYTEEPLSDAVRARAPSDKECYEFNEVFLTYEVFESRASDADTLENENGHHQMLGYPLYIQDEDMAPGQTLLLQIDTDEEDDGPCWMWGSDRKIWRPDDSTGSCLCWNADNDAVMTKDMNLRDSGIVLSWLSGLLAAFMSSLAGLWGKTGLAALFGEDVLLPNLTECFFTMSHGFWLVPICMGILLITTRKQKAIQDTVVLASWSISVLWRRMRI